MSEVLEVTTTETPAEVKPALDLRFYSHATLDSKNLTASRRFFKEFLGFETVQMSKVAFWARMGGDQIIVVVQSTGKEKEAMPFLNHNGLDVGTEAEVDKAYEIVMRDKDQWGLTKISRPVVQHGSYCFYFWYADDNAWEIICNPKGGYGWGFELGDQEGMGLMKKNFQRPASTLTKA